MSLDLSQTQLDLAEKIAKHTKDACKLVGLKCEKCEPRNFYLTVNRYYGRISGMTAEVDRCIDWCLAKNKRVFTALRFANWCANKVKWDKEQQLVKAEKEKLKSGTEYQQAEYARRFLQE
jgi:beta-galactosidase/beta-glucuronidase